MSENGKVMRWGRELDAGGDDGVRRRREVHGELDDAAQSPELKKSSAHDPGIVSCSAEDANRSNVQKPHIRYSPCPRQRFTTRPPPASGPTSTSIDPSATSEFRSFSFFSTSSLEKETAPHPMIAAYFMVCGGHLRVAVDRAAGLEYRVLYQPVAADAHSIAQARQSFLDGVGPVEKHAQDNLSAEAVGCEPPKRRRRPTSFGGLLSSR